jgi:shikimate dehydrogenase
MSSKASAPRLGLIGHPVSHSLSPRIFETLSAALARPVSYEAVDVIPEELAGQVAQLKSVGFRGVNVTIPHKRAILPLLDSLTEEASAIGAVNAVLFKDGAARGHNTDAAGFLDALLALGFNPKGRDAVIFGAGGAARAAAWALAKSGAQSVRICARDPKKAGELARELAGLSSCAVDAGASRPAELWVNATPLGMRGFPDEAPFTGEARCEAAFDLVYGRKTAFLREAERAGAKSCDGLEMLLCQALRAWEYWFAPIPAAKRLNALLELRRLLTHA